MNLQHSGAEDITPEIAIVPLLVWGEQFEMPEALRKQFDQQLLIWKRLYRRNIIHLVPMVSNQSYVEKPFVLGHSYLPEFERVLLWVELHANTVFVVGLEGNYEEKNGLLISFARMVNDSLSLYIQLSKSGARFVSG